MNYLAYLWDRASLLRYDGELPTGCSGFNLCLGGDSNAVIVARAFKGLNDAVHANLLNKVGGSDDAIAEPVGIGDGIFVDGRKFNKKIFRVEVFF